MIGAGIVVDIPKKCYISSDPKRTAPFEFYFHISYGIIPRESRLQREAADPGVAGYPQITVAGFEKLLSEDRIQDFIDSLKIVGSDDWTVKKRAAGSDILFRYVGDGLPEDFSLRASLETFVSDAKANDLVTLIVRTERFDEVEDAEYVICTKVDYTPFAKSLSASQETLDLGGQTEIAYECLGDHIDKRLYQNGQQVHTARSPYTAVIDMPSLFTLEVFNEAGMTDKAQIWVDVNPPRIVSFAADCDYFSPGDERKLTWNVASASNIAIEGLGPGDTAGENDALIHPKTVYGEKTVTYRLRAHGYTKRKPDSVSLDVCLYRSNWKNSGAASGYFSDDAAFSNGSYNRHIFTYGNAYYCYANPVLYKSTDGCCFQAFSKNDRVADSFICLAADVIDDTLYAMGKEGEEGKELFYTAYDFGRGVWSYRSGMQTCVSDEAAFSYYNGRPQYAQMRNWGILLVSFGGEYWNGGTISLTVPDGRTLICGDVCFFNNQNYAAFFTDDCKLYVYCYTPGQEALLFTGKLEQPQDFIRFAPSENRLYVITEKAMYDVARQKKADYYFPGQQNGQPWMGRDLEGNLFGIFPDKCRWVYEETVDASNGRDDHE